MVEIYVNGEKRQIAQEVTLQALLELFSLPQQRVAVELNKEVVRRQDWPSTYINNADRIEIVHFVGGG